MEFKERLRLRRKEKGLSQNELAAIVSVTQGAIQSLESGRIKKCTFLWEIAVALQVNPDWLLRGTEPKELASIFTGNHLSIVSVPLLTIDEIKNWLYNDLLPPRCKRFNMTTTDLNISNKTFLYKIEGDAMVSSSEPYKSLFPNELALIDPNLIPVEGNAVLALINNKELKIRQYMRDGNEFLLKAHNTAYPLIVMKKDIKILGVVVLTQKMHISID